MFVLLSVFVYRSQSNDLNPPANPDHWKINVEAEKKYSLESKKWNVAFKFTNVSGKKDRLMTGNGSLMYRVKAFMLNEAGERIGEVKTRTFSAYALSSVGHGHAEPGGVIWTECDIRLWLAIDKPGHYEIHADRLLSMEDAGDNAVGLPMKNVMKIAPFKIEVVR